MKELNESWQDECGLASRVISSDSPQAALRHAGPALWTLPRYLEHLLEEKALKRVHVIREAKMNPTFGYQIFKGQRGASRDKLLRLALAMHLSLAETTWLLRVGDASMLTCRDGRDAIIVYGLHHGYSVDMTNDVLYQLGLDTLG